MDYSKIPPHIAKTIIKDSEVKKSVMEKQAFISKFKDPLTGLTFMFLDASLEFAKECGYLKEEREEDND